MFGAVRFLSPKTCLRLDLAALATGVLVIVLVAFFSTRTIHREADEFSRESAAALQAAGQVSDLADLIGVITLREAEFLSSSEVASLPPARIDAIRAELHRVDTAAPSATAPPLLVPLSLREALDFQRTTDSFAVPYGPLGYDDDEKLDGLKAALITVRQATDAYFDAPTIANLGRLHATILQARAIAETTVPILASAAGEYQKDLHGATNYVRLAMIGIVVAIAAALFTTRLIIGRHIAAAFDLANSEKAALELATESLGVRNSQLSALYNVFTEITDSLSLRYVVTTAVREALKLIDADVSTLRLLRGGELVVEGSMTVEGEPVVGLTSLDLGEGPAGRAAKRGRTVRIDRDAHAHTADGTWAAEMESALIVPMIVGARIVGTLGCWSHRPNAFNEEDQRVLEMMASQIATAVVAADTTESSERRAHHDPLTDLPNRLQLNEDLAGDLSEMVLNGRRAAVAMADIDHFKLLNDEFGHRVGDVTLQAVASALRNSIREEDRVYRYGGEEFVLVFPDTTGKEALALAERVRANIESMPHTGDHLEPVGPVTISIGIALLPEHSTDLNALIGLADNAMYQAKDAGRNRVLLWSEDSAAPADASQDDGPSATKRVA